MSKNCNCDGTRVQKNRYNPCNHTVDPSEQYYNKDQIECLVNEILSNKDELVDKLSGVLDGKILNLQQIVNNVYNKQEFIEQLLQSFIASSYGDLFNEIQSYITNLHNGTAVYNQEIINGYIAQVEALPNDTSWKENILTVLYNLLDTENNTYIVEYDRGIESVTYRYGYSESAITGPAESLWYSDELAALQDRNAHIGEWYWVEKTISFVDTKVDNIVTYEKYYIPREGDTTIVETTYAVSDSVGQEHPQDSDFIYNDLESALTNAGIRDCIWEKIVVTYSDKPTETSYFIAYPTIQYDSEDPGIPWPPIGPYPEAVPTISDLEFILSYYRDNITDDNASVYSQYIQILQSLIDGTSTWIEAVNNYGDIIASMMQDLGESSISTEGAVTRTLDYYTLVLEVLNKYAAADTEVISIEQSLVFSADNYVTKERFDEGIQEILDTIISLSDPEKCECSSPIDSIIHTINELKQEINDLKVSISQGPVQQKTTDIPDYIAVPFLKNPTYDTIKNGPGPGWFPITPSWYNTLEAAQADAAKWKNIFGDDIDVTTRQFGTAKIYLMSITRYKAFNFPLSGHELDSFVMAPSNKEALLGFGGSNSITLTTENMPPHNHGENGGGTLKVIDNVGHTHDVYWGRANAKGGGYYGGQATTGQDFPSGTKTDPDAPLETIWYGQGRTTRPSEGFVQKAKLTGNLSLSANLTEAGGIVNPLRQQNIGLGRRNQILPARITQPFTIKPYSYHTPYLIRIAVPDTVVM